MSDLDILPAVHRTLIAFNKRAERSSDAMLVTTFVDSAPLFDLLSTPNNQVIYGRRGTGKTHALKFLAENVEFRGENPIYLDLRSVGSNGSIYADGGRPLTERASTLLLDVLDGLYDELFRLALAKIDIHPNPQEVTRRLDALQAALSTVEVSGQPAVEVTDASTRNATTGWTAIMGLACMPSAVISARAGVEAQQARTEKVTRTGREVVHLMFGNIAGAIADLLSVLNAKRIWLLIDEWSEIPVELQPYLADLARRTLLPINDITIKIAAIEHRSDFAILKERREYIGLELGADVSADLNLDDFLVFDNGQEKSTQFVKTLLFIHYLNNEDAPKFENADQFVQAIFTQYPAFEEFVRAVEGVPRDALNLAAKIATKAFSQRVAMQHVRSAAIDLYSQDKAAAIRSSPELNDLLGHIVEQVIGTRRARAFCFPATSDMQVSRNCLIRAYCTCSRKMYRRAINRERGSMSLRSTMAAMSTSSTPQRHLKVCLNWMRPQDLLRCLATSIGPSVGRYYFQRTFRVDLSRIAAHLSSLISNDFPKDKGSLPWASLRE